MGKSCLLHRLTNNEFLTDHEVTVGVEFGTLLVKLEQQVFKLQIWDTAGQESFKSITKIFYRGAHCIFLAYDITRLETFNNLNTWYNEVMDQSEPDVILFLVGNKLDMEDKREVSQDRVEKFKKEKGILFHFETSAMTGENIEDLFIMASKILYHNFKDKIAQLVSRPLVNRLDAEGRSHQEEAAQEAEEAGAGVPEHPGRCEQAGALLQVSDYCLT